MPQGKSAVGVAYLRHIRIRKLTIPNVMCGGREVQSLRHSAGAIPDGCSNAVPGMKERVEER